MQPCLRTAARAYPNRLSYSLLNLLAQLHAVQSKPQAMLGVDLLPDSSDGLSLERTAAQLHSQLSALPGTGTQR